MREIFLWMLLLLTAAEGMLYGSETTFAWTLTRSGKEVRATVRVQPGHYLYAARTVLTGKAGERALFWHAPAGVPKDGETVYPSGQWHWMTEAPPEAGLTVTAEYQGCSEDGVCYLPGKVTLSGAPEKGDTSPFAVPPFRVLRCSEGVLPPEQMLAFLSDTGTAVPAEPVRASWWWMVLAALAGGIMLNFTPCILPMIPVNLAIIGGSENWKKGLVTASFYGSGMALAYGVLGLAAVLGGARFGFLNGSSWFNFIIAGIFAVLALAMFGVFSLDFSGAAAKLPVRRMQKRGLFLAFFLGVVSALLAGACVAPVLIAVLIFSAETYSSGNPAGLLMPLVLGIGMALPWPAVGAGLAVLPKPGAWMNRVKNLFGIVILAAAGYYAWFGISLLPGRWDPAKEISCFREVLDTGRPAVVEFWASWCKNCRAMEKTTFRDRAVQRALARRPFIRFQAEKFSDPAVRKVLDLCGVKGLPATVIVQGEK